MNAHDTLVKTLDKLTRRDLISTARVLGKERGTEWLIGGPDDWSKDELINYIAKEYR